MSASDDNDLGGYRRPDPAPYVAPTAAPINPTDFNPFAALGLQPATATLSHLRPAYLRAVLHRGPGQLLRYPDTATAFPAQVEVQLAYDWLASPGAIATAARIWGATHEDVFFPQLPLGDAGVFRLATHPRANTRASASPPRARPAATTPPATAAAASSSSRPRKARRTTAPSASSSSTHHGGTFNDPFCLSSSDSDDDAARDEHSPTPSKRARRPATATPSRAKNAIPRPAAAAAAAAHAGSHSRPPAPAPASGLVPPGARHVRTPTRPSQRSGGNSIRNASIANPVTDDRIIVGTWANATAAATPNAVVAGFDNLGRIFYRVTREDLHGNAVPAPIATATRFEDINFRAAYQNMTADQVRTAVDTHLRLNPYLRP